MGGNWSGRGDSTSDPNLAKIVPAIFRSFPLLAIVAQPIDFVALMLDSG
jgi:hypothetical protein